MSFFKKVIGVSWYHEEPVESEDPEDPDCSEDPDEFEDSLGFVVLGILSLIALIFGDLDE